MTINKQKIHLFTLWALVFAISLPIYIDANTGAGKPVANGRQVLVVYTDDVGFSASVVTSGANGRNLQQVLSGGGANFYNFNVELLPV